MHFLPPTLSFISLLCEVKGIYHLSLSPFFLWTSKIAPLLFYTNAFANVTSLGFSFSPFCLLQINGLCPLPTLKFHQLSFSSILKPWGRVPFEPLSFIMFCFPPPNSSLLRWQICPFCQSLSICRGDYSLCPGARMLRKLKGSVKWPAW